MYTYTKCFAGNMQKKRRQMPGRMGNDTVMRLNELSIGSTATIRAVGGSGALRQHFLDMGLIQGTEVTVIKYAPMGESDRAADPRV